MIQLNYSSYFERLNVKRVIFSSGKVQWTTLYLWEQGQNLGRKVLTWGDPCRWAALWKLQSLTALQVSKETRSQDRVGPSWTLEEDPSWEACSRAKARHSWSRVHLQKPRLGGFRFRLDRHPVWRLVCLVRGSGYFKHDARCHLGGRVTPHPGTPLSQGSWVNTTPTHGPNWPSVVEIPWMHLRVKYLHSIDFPFICGKSICFSWFPVFAF